jgi:hypothetical protein
MDTTFVLIGALATFINFAVIKWKLEKERFLDVAVDGGVLAIISYLFMGTATGLAISMGASALMSLYLLAFPPKFAFLQ